MRFPQKKNTLHIFFSPPSDLGLSPILNQSKNNLQGPNDPNLVYDDYKLLGSKDHEDRNLINWKMFSQNNDKAHHFTLRHSTSINNNYISLEREA